MNAKAGDAFFDANTLQNFAVVDRLDLLKAHYGARIRWTETVRFEVQRGIRAEPRLQRILDAEWLGDPIEISGDPATLSSIEFIRRGLGGNSVQQLQHLGEAEIIYYLEKVEPGGFFVTDDRPAADFAHRRGITVIDTPGVLSECHSYGEIGCPDAYVLLQAMADNDRGVRVPADHRAICP
ncbi:hypothetical protein GCM10009555_078950 [Acrocarpospora macrocephala]|uniref:PIN domain-containing protein n=1 Tax=Acrocarpospora macrocephala TaxID=150177 RepID=A0A5M3X6R1_9ACTN|nr:hypothetical protein [Acrocarpospora macrocephala]GES16352.1 hypothetical protein Amac_099500 [Acrocarpospora macrocephala]